MSNVRRRDSFPPATSRPEIYVFTERGVHHGHIVACPRTRVAALLPCHGVRTGQLVAAAEREELTIRYVLVREDMGSFQEEVDRCGSPWVGMSPSGALLLSGSPVRPDPHAPSFTWHGERRPDGSTRASKCRLSLGGFHIQVDVQENRLAFCVRGAIFCSGLGHVTPPAWERCIKASGSTQGTHVYPSASAASDVFSVAFARSLEKGRLEQERTAIFLSDLDLSDVVLPEDE